MLANHWYVHIGMHHRPRTMLTFSKRYSEADLRTVSTCVFGDQSRYLKTKHDLFLKLTECFLCLNLTRPQARCTKAKTWSCNVKKSVNLSTIVRNVWCQYLFWRFGWNHTSKLNSHIRYSSQFPGILQMTEFGRWTDNDKDLQLCFYKASWLKTSSQLPKNSY